MDFKMKAIGIIHTPLIDKDDAPIQSARSNLSGTVEIYADYLEGLEAIENFSHIYLLYAFHRSEKISSLKVQPFLDDHFYGVFATRYPCRPNPIGFSVVRLIERKGNNLIVNGVDMLDETPLLDIKPYIPDFDVFSTEKTGWYQNRKYD